MSRRSKLGVALLLALALHGLLLWRPGPGKPPAESGPPGDGEAVIAVDWVAGTRSDLPVPVPPPAAADGARTATDTAVSHHAGRAVGERSGAGVPGAEPRDYGERVRRHLSRFAGDLPGAAGGEARVRFTVDAEGNVSAIELLRSSGDPQLDEAALALPGQAAPLPLPAVGSLRLEVPVRAAGPAP